MKKLFHSCRGLSLVEVLVATAIIAIALYGLVLSISLQSLSEAQSRQQQYIKALHYQLVSELLDGYRVPEDRAVTFSNDGLPGVSLTYTEAVTTAATPPYVTSTLSWTSKLVDRSVTKQDVIYVVYRP